MDKIIIIGGGDIGKVASVIKEASSEIIVVSDEKERGLTICNPKPFLLKNTIQPYELNSFKEPKNFINGKKLPRRKKRK